MLYTSNPIMSYAAEEGIAMATSGIGRPVVLNEKGIETMRIMLKKSRRLLNESRRASDVRRDFTSVRTLSQVR